MVQQFKTIEDLFEYTRKELEGKTGKISIDFAQHQRSSSSLDIIGNCLQEWLPDWFSHLSVQVAPGAHTQKFPDFTATFNGVPYDVEVKAWNYAANPGFDLSNFDSFLSDTFQSPSKLGARYFILAYTAFAPNSFQQGFKVERVYFKRIWELVSRSGKHPITVQVKKDRVYAIRPGNFHTKPEAMCKSYEEFIQGVYETFKKFPNKNLPFTPEEWLQQVSTYSIR